MIIFKYLARQVLTTMLAVTLVLLLIFMSGRFIKYLSQAAAGGLSPDVLFSIMAFRLPGFLELILPLGFFIGILLAYGRMYLESEMTVLHACGLSRRRLLSFTLVMSLFVMAAVGAMSLYLSPLGMQNVERLFQEQSKVTEFEMLYPGKFQALKSGNRVTYTESLSDDKKTMHDVFISEPATRGEGLVFLHAKTGTQSVDAITGDRFLVLHEGTRYEGISGSAEYQVIHFESYGIKIATPDGEQRAAKEEAIDTLELIGSQDLRQQALFQWRVSLPLLVPVVTLLAVSLCQVNPRQGRFFHLFPAMLIYVVYIGLLIVARKNLIAASLPAWFGLWGVHLLFLAIAVALLTRHRWMPEIHLLSLFKKAKT